MHLRQGGDGDGGKVLWITFIPWLVIQIWMVGVKCSDKYFGSHVTFSVVVVYLKKTLCFSEEKLAVTQIHDQFH